MLDTYVSGALLMIPFSGGSGAVVLENNITPNKNMKASFVGDHVYIRTNKDVSLKELANYYTLITMDDFYMKKYRLSFLIDI